VPSNLLYTYWTHATSLLVPLADVVRSMVLAEDVVGVDDTSLPVLDKSRKAGIYKGHLWCFSGKRLVAYAFTESWSADEVAPFLSAVDGFIQCDDYKGYGREIKLSENRFGRCPPDSPEQTWQQAMPDNRTTRTMARKTLVT
jgi:Transposase IS66 family